MHPLSCTLGAILEEKAKNSMEKEIRVLRELLSNFQEELHYIRLQDKKKWEKVMQDRFFLLQTIKELRRATEGMSWNESSHELAFLVDQVIALVQKIAELGKYNNAQQEVAISPSIFYPKEELSHLAKKSGVTTLL